MSVKIDDGGLIEFIHEGTKTNKTCIKSVERGDTRVDKAIKCGLWCICCNLSKAPIHDARKNVVGMADVVMITCGKIPFNIEIEKLDIVKPEIVIHPSDMKGRKC